MLGSLSSLLGFGLILLLVTIWMCVKIWRRSPLLAIGAFLFWPLSILALVLYWRDEEADIRVPFFLSLVLTLLIGFMAARLANKGLEEMAWGLSDEDIAEIRAEDPALAAELEEARARAIAERGEPVYAEGEYDDDTDSDIEAPRRARRTAADAPQAPLPAPREFTPAEIEAQQRAELDSAVQALSWRFGLVDLSPAPVTLHLPREFRFVPRTQVFRVARLRGTPVTDDVLGWVVHRQVDLSRDDAWYVQLRYVPMTTRLSPPLSTGNSVADAEAQARFVTQIAAHLRADTQPHLPAWNGAQRLASWRWVGKDAGDTRHDYVGAQILPGGILEFSVPGLHDVHAELGARSARFVAQRTMPKGR